MIHLRKFNESSEDDNKYYQEIDEPGVDSTEWNYVDFSKVEQLRDLLADQEGIDLTIETYGYPESDKRELVLDVDREGSVVRRVEIFELDDEWYVDVFDKKEGDEIWERWYKCDQYDGLIKLLKDKKIIRSDD